MIAVVSFIVLATKGTSCSTGFHRVHPILDVFSHILEGSGKHSYTNALIYAAALIHESLVS